MEEKLNPQQQEAVDYKNGPLLIIAGAGTGKTKVITQRIEKIVKEKWATPSQILALTFTEKAASQMKERVDELLPISYEEPWISTFHSFCDGILRQEAGYIGLDSNYKLMTPAQSYILFRKHLFEFPLKHFKPLGNPNKFITDILSHFSRLQDEDVTSEEYIKYLKTLLKTTPEEKEIYQQTSELAYTYEKYIEVKVKESKMDFGDLINFTLKLFRERPNVLKRYHEKYKYILVDEYQDSNYTQNVLVNLLALGKEQSKATEKDKKVANITVVGDDDQSIYKFRGAAISNILQFKKLYKDAKTVVLTTNYRSTQEILDSAYRCVQNNNPYRLESTEKVSKKLVAVKGKGEGSVQLLFEKDGEREAERISSEIKQLVGKEEAVDIGVDTKGQSRFDQTSSGYKYGDIAVLVRANNHADEIANSFRLNEIPYKLGGSRSLYQRPEIKVLISFLKALVDPSNSSSIFNIISMKDWGILPRDVVEVVRKARRSKDSLYQVLEDISKGERAERLEKKTVEKIREIFSIFEEGMKMLTKGKTGGEILFLFFQRSGLLEKYRNDETGNYLFQVENTRKYFDMVNDFWEINPTTTLFEYIDYLEYSQEIGESPSVDSDAFDLFNAVNIVTVHSAKGLEFPVVFVANLVSERFPTNNRRERLPIPEKLIKEVLPAGGENIEHFMEERRLFYVALTRAKEKLYLTAANFYGAGKRKKKPSMFLYETLERDIDKEFIIEGVKDKNDVEGISGLSSNFLDYKALDIPVPNEFSYSQISLFEHCPIQYKYQYIIGIPSKTNSAASFGTTMHNTLKYLYERLRLSKEGLEGFNKIPTKKEVVEYFDKSWVGLGYESREHERQRKEEGRELISSYYDKVFSIDETPLELEKSFSIAIDDFKIKGRVDRVDKVGVEDGKTVVELVDYKTGRAKDKKSCQKEWQLQLYAYAVENTTNYKVGKASYMFVEENKKVEIDIHLEKINKVLNNIRGMVGKIRRGEFTVPEGHECIFCKSGDICDDAII